MIGIHGDDVTMIFVTVMEVVELGKDVEVEKAADKSILKKTKVRPVLLISSLTGKVGNKK
jgi:hypothetical protein